jgi:cobalt/nickel transport system permease protein
LLLLFVIWLPFAGGGAGWELGPVWVSERGLWAAALVCLKAGAILTLGLLVAAGAPLNETLQAASSLRVPDLLVHVILLTYRYVFVVTGEFTRLRTALRVRGYHNRATLHSYRTVGHVAGTLLVRGSERAGRVGQAMTCRGFDGQFRSLAKPRTRAVDVIAFWLLAGGALGLVAWDHFRP